MTFLDNEGVELTDIEEAAMEGVRRGRAIVGCKGLIDEVRLEAGSIVIDDEWQTILELPLEA